MSPSGRKRERPSKMEARVLTGGKVKYNMMGEMALGWLRVDVYKKGGGMRSSQEAVELPAGIK